MRVKLSDWVVNFLTTKGVDTIFSVSGGMIAHLLESVKNSDKIKHICNRHEQASAMSAEGYAYTKNTPACVLVTNGPGASNAITGVVGAFQGSIPMIVISGQVPINQSVGSSSVELRQLGVQELDIIPLVKPITKYCVQVKNPSRIKYILERAYHECISGRMGPVWIEIPLDIQAAIIDTDNIDSYVIPHKQSQSAWDANKIYSLIKSSKRPLIVAGNGIRLSGCEDLFKSIIGKLDIPVVTSWLAKDLMDYYDDFYVGGFGILGDRAGNFAIQNADLLLILGCRMSLSNVGYNYLAFSPKSIKIMVDIDAGELNKKTVNIDYKVNADLADVLSELNNWDDSFFSQEWVTTCNNWKRNHPVFLPKYKDNRDKINCFYFSEVLSDKLVGNEVIVTDMGSSYTAMFQSLRLHGGTRMFTSSSTASMGFGVCGAIGAYYADRSKRIILIAGDGGFCMNIQELQTIIQYNIPIKIFILNNNGYLAISLMQDNLFNGNYIGSTSNSGVSAPDFVKIANAYGIRAVRFNNNNELNEGINSVLNFPGPVLCEIMMPEHQLLIPRVQSSKDKDGNIVSGTLDNMFPFLDEKI